MFSFYFRQGFYPHYGGTPFVSTHQTTRNRNWNHREFKLQEEPVYGPQRHRTQPSYTNKFPFVPFRRSSSFISPSSGNMNVLKVQRISNTHAKDTARGPISSAHYDQQSENERIFLSTTAKKTDEKFHWRPRPLLHRKDNVYDRISRKNNHQFIDKEYRFNDNDNKLSRTKQISWVKVQPKLMVRDAEHPDIKILDADSHHPYSLLYMHYIPPKH